MSAVPPIFKQKDHQILFEKNGYVKVSLLSTNQADELSAYFDSTKELHKSTTSLHHTSTDTQNLDLIYGVDAKIKSALMPELEKVLIDFKPLAGCFHIKEPGKGSATGVHQDPTFVDETTYCSVNVWVALHEMNSENGNLYFISGSHKVAPSLRITPYSPNYYESFSQSLIEIAEEIPMKKGEAVIFSNGTIHGATDNISSNIRLAATLLVCSKSADWQIYYNDPANANYDNIELYHLNFETFASMVKNGRPNASTFQKTLSYKFPTLTKEEFMKKVGYKKESSFWKRLFNSL